MTNLEFENKIEPLRSYIYSVICKKVKYDGFLAEDLTQKTFIKAFVYFKNHPIRDASYKTLLFKIVDHVVIDHYKKTKTLNLILDMKPDCEEKEYEYIIENDFSSSLVDNLFEKDIIKESLEELKKQNHQIYETLIDAIDDIPYNDIALKNNIPLNTVKTRVHRARKFLQKYLELKNINFETLSVKD